MAKIVFWNQSKNVSGNTHVALAVTTLLSVKYKAKSILLQSNFQSPKMEASFTPYEELKQSGVFDNTDIGLGALMKIIVSNKLTPTVIKNYTKPLLKDRLDIMYGVLSKEKEQYKAMLSNLQFIIRKADEIYDLVLVDLTKGTEKQEIINVVKDADVVIHTINQDIINLDDFFNDIEKNPYLAGKEKIFVIGNYDEKSKYNAYNIRKKYRIKDPIYILPQNFGFVDSCNDGRVIDFFWRNENAPKGDYNGNFIHETSKIVDKLIELSKIKDY